MLLFLVLLLFGCTTQPAATDANDSFDLTQEYDKQSPPLLTHKSAVHRVAKKPSRDLKGSWYAPHVRDLESKKQLQLTEKEVLKELKEANDFHGHLPRENTHSFKLWRKLVRVASLLKADAPIFFYKSKHSFGVTGARFLGVQGRCLVISIGIAQELIKECDQYKDFLDRLLFEHISFYTNFTKLPVGGTVPRRALASSLTATFFGILTVSPFVTHATAQDFKCTPNREALKEYSVFVDAGIKAQPFIFENGPTIDQEKQYTEELLALIAQDYEHLIGKNAFFMLEEDEEEEVRTIARDVVNKFCAKFVQEKLAQVSSSSELLVSAPVQV